MTVDVKLRMILDGIPVATDPIGDALRAAATAYYKLESSGADATGRGNTLTNNSGTFGIGKVSNAFLLSNSPTEDNTQSGHQYLTSVINNADLSIAPGTDCYIAFWAKITATNEWNQYCAQYDTVLLANGIDISRNTQGTLVLTTSTGGGDNQARIENAITDTNWHFIEAYIKDGIEIGIAIDNGAWTVQALLDPVATIDAPFYLGCYADPDSPIFDYLNGAIDEFGIYKPSAAIETWLTSAKRTYLYNNGAGRTLFP